MAQAQTNNDPFAAYQKPLTKSDPFAAYQTPLPDLDKPTGEGVYWMSDKSGKKKPISYSNVRQAIQTGYTMSPESADVFSSDIAADPSAATKFFPELNLPTGRQIEGKNVAARIVGINSAGQPIFGPAGAAGPQGSVMHRLGQSFVEPITGTVKGTWDLLTKGPQNDEEAQIRRDPITGPIDLRLNRLILAPMRSEAAKTAEEFRQANQATDPETRHEHQAATIGHALATALPIVGPAAAQTGEKLGTQLGTGDYAGAAGTIAGNLALEEAPRLVGKGLRSEYVTKSMPQNIVRRLIKSSSSDRAFGKDPVQAILDNGIVGKDLRTIGDGVYAKMHEVGQKIDAMAQSPAFAGKRVNVGDALKPFDEAIDKASTQKPVNVALYRALVKARSELYLEYVEASMKGGGSTLRPVGPANLRMSPVDALQFKRGIGDRINWNKDPIQGVLNQAYGEAYGITKDALNKELGGDFAKLNKQYSDLVGAAKSIERQVPIEERGANWKLTDIVLGATGHPGIAAARMVAHHPGIRSRGARFLYRTLPNTPAPGVGVRAPAALGAQIGAYGHQKKKEDTANTGAQVDTDVAAPAGEPEPSAPDTSHDTLVDRAAIAYDVNPDLIRAVMGQESGGNAGAVSVKGATGLMQIMPDIAKKYGVIDATDPSQNVMGGVHYLRDLLDKHDGDVVEALKDYYGRGTPPPGYPSTDEYVQSVLGRFASLTEAATPSTPAPAPLPVVKAEAAQRKPSPVTRVQATAPLNPPNKKYWQTATGPDNHKIGTDDGATWFDIQTGQQVE